MPLGPGMSPGAPTLLLLLSGSKRTYSGLLEGATGRAVAQEPQEEGDHVLSMGWRGGTRVPAR